MIKLQEKIIEESKNDYPPEHLSRGESEKLLPVKSMSKEMNFNDEGYVPQQFQNLEAQGFDQIKQEYDHFNDYNANRHGEEHPISENSNDIETESNYLHRDLDPVEEEDNSQKSFKNSQNQRISCATSEKDLEPDHIPQKDNSIEPRLESESEYPMQE